MNGGKVFGRGSVFSALGSASSLRAVAEFVEIQYGFIAEAVRLKSERDENFRVVTANGEERLFKLAHPAEDRRIVDFQTQALLHVASLSPGIPLQRLVPTLAGDFETAWRGTDGMPRQARMFTYLPGVPLNTLRQTRGQAAAMGALAARLDASLSGFRHPASGHELLWDIQHAARTRELLTHTRSRADRELCEGTIDDFERHVAPRLRALRAQVIHNDLNPHNVLVNPDDPDQVTGIIDFGDMVHAPLIDEVAVASAYLLMSNDAPLGTVPEFVAAYHAVNPLAAAEIAVLPQLIAVRHAITIAITNWRAATHPENQDYILRNQQSAIGGLNKLVSLRADVAREQLLVACSAGSP
jgi:Ser/Thr protein kinase RdoA (MazF antagonist)